MSGIATLTDEDFNRLKEDNAKRSALLRPLPETWTVRDLLETEFPPPTWIIPGLLTTGLTILAGAPKLGKSWLALGMGVAVGSGGAVMGQYHVEMRKGLYLALEDTPRRLKDRLGKIKAPAVSDLAICTEWRHGTEGIQDLDDYLTACPETKLVIIDTLAKFRVKPKPGQGIYEADYDALGLIKACADRHEVAIVVIHHTRKAQSDDIMDAISGSQGINGSADGTWVLTRARGESDASLYMTGRDTEEQTIALRFDKEIMTWAVMGDAHDYTESKERREILDLFKGGQRMKPKAIAEALGRDPKSSTHRVILKKMVDAGRLDVDAEGAYGDPVNTLTRIPPINTINSVNKEEESVYAFTPFTGYTPATETEEELEIW